MDRAASCDQVRDAWEEAGGTAADIDDHLAAMERISELGIGTSLRPEELRNCFDLFQRIDRAVACVDKDLSLASPICPASDTRPLPGT